MSFLFKVVSLVFSARNTLVLIPILIAMILAAFLVTVAQGTNWSPFIYAEF